MTLRKILLAGAALALAGASALAQVNVVPQVGQINSIINMEWQESP